MTYIDKIYNELIDEMVKRLKATSLEEFKNYREWAEKNHNIIINLVELKQMEPVVDVAVEEVVEPVNVIAEPVNVIAEPVNVIAEPTQPYPLGRDFVFEKKAFGGVLTQLEYPIPEELVRNYDLENGNILRITGTNGFFTDGTPRYMFEVVNHDSEPNPQLIEVKQGLVTRIGGRLAVEQTANGKMIKVDEVPATLFIQERDIITRNHRIVEGDIIDGRFYSNNLTNSFRVTYKHDTESESEATIEGKKSVYRKKIQTKQKRDSP